MKFNIIFVCDECLDELVVPNEEFQPAVHPVQYDKWWIQDVIMMTHDGYRAVPSSSFVTKCPKCRRKEYVHKR